MMLYPAMNKLTEYIPNRYMMVNVVARRAARIAEAEATGQHLDEKPVTLAIHEVAEGQVRRPHHRHGDRGRLREGSSMTQIAKVAVAAATYAIDKPYDYLVPSGMELSVGCRVTVPFGQGNRTAEGMVLQLRQEVPAKPLKAIRSLLDQESVLSEKEIRLALWMRQRYFCTFYDALHTILPAAVWYRYREIWASAPRQGRRALRNGSRRCAGCSPTARRSERPSAPHWGRDIPSVLYQMKRRDWFPWRRRPAAR